MKIVQLSAENFKRLKAVRISPDGTVCQITGRNAQGKSSVLDAVWAALGGKAASPEKPIREGTEKAKVVLDLGSLKVTRRWTGSGSTLTVDSADGARYPSPQSVLDELVGRLSFDPLAFVRMDAKQQAQTLRDLVGVDTSSLEKLHAARFEARTEQNRLVKMLIAQLADLPDVDAPAKEVSISELLGKQTEAIARQHANQRLKEDAIRATDTVERCVKKVENLERQLEQAREELDDFLTRRDEAVNRMATLIEPDLGDISLQIAAAEKTNKAVRAKWARADKTAELERAIKQAADLTIELDTIEADKSKALQAVRFPIDGLSLSGADVLYRGQPLSQASSAEQLRVGLAIGGALNPKLRVVLVRDGSLLDADSMNLVAEWAEREGMQVLIERVSDGGVAGVVIEDGEVSA